MKNMLIIILIIVLTFSGCSKERETWKEINIVDIGTLKIPQEWTYNEKDGIIHISNKETNNSTDNEISIIGIIYEKGQTDRIYRQFKEKIEYVKLISSEAFSNSATIGRNEYLINGYSREKYFLEIYSLSKQLFILVWDDTSNYEILKEIAKSYKMSG